MTDDDDTTTTNPKTRYEHTGSIAALSLVWTACAVVLAHTYMGTETPLYAAASFPVAVFAALAWAFGESALKAARESWGKGDSP